MTKADPHREETLSAFGANLKRLRQAAGFTQAELAGKADLHAQYVSASERGEINISLVNLMKLARALEVEPAALLEGMS